MTNRGRNQALRWLFLASPLFWFVDATLGWNVRITALDDPGHRHIYYAGLTAVGGLLWRWPIWTPLAALVEPALNFSLLIIDAWQLIFQAPAAAFAGAAPELISGGRLLNFLLSGGMLYLGVQSAIHGLRPGAHPPD